MSTRTQPTRTPLQVQNLRTVANALLQEPDRYNQNQWIEYLNPDNNNYDEPPITIATTPACDTQACVAGHAVLLTAPPELLRNYIRDIPADNDTASYAYVHVTCDPYNLPSLAVTAAQLLGLDEKEAAHVFNYAWVPDYTNDDNFPNMSTAVAATLFELADDPDADACLQGIVLSDDGGYYPNPRCRAEAQGAAARHDYCNAVDAADDVAHAYNPNEPSTPVTPYEADERS